MAMLVNVNDVDLEFFFEDECKKNYIHGVKHVHHETRSAVNIDRPHWHVRISLSNGDIVEGELITDERNGDDMSTNLYWRPSVSHGEEMSRALSDALKSYYVDNMEPTTVLNTFDVSILRAMKAAGVEESQKLIDAINEHGAVIITSHRK